MAKSSAKTNKPNSASFRLRFLNETRLRYYYHILQLFAFIAILAHRPSLASGQIAYKKHMSQLRIQELRNVAERMQKSINRDKYACDNYYDYVCSRNNPMYSMMGNLPNITELMQLLIEIQEDHEQFDAKRKVHDFFISCNARKSIEDCYRETFEYFKPVFGYIITKHYINGSITQHHDFLDVLDRFLKKAESIEDFARNPIRLRLQQLKEKFRQPNIYFRAEDLDREYYALRTYRESYEHNLRNLEQHRRRNSSYEVGIQRIMLDWTLYVFQSRNKPMSYYFPTLNVHLWMTLYNNTVRYIEPKRIRDIGECLSLPQYVNVLEEARLLAIIYLKSFRNAWQEYMDWIGSNDMIFNQENQILHEFGISNYHIFFTLYAQNFCDFGKELAENIFFIGLKQNRDFFNNYCHGYQTEARVDCIL